MMLFQSTFVVNRPARSLHFAPGLDHTLLLEDLVCLHSRLQGEPPREHSRIVLIGR